MRCRPLQKEREPVDIAFSKKKRGFFGACSCQALAAIVEKIFAEEYNVLSKKKNAKCVLNMEPIWVRIKSGNYNQWCACD